MKQTTTDEVARRKHETGEKLSPEERRRRSRHMLAMLQEMQERRERWRKKNGWGD